MVRVATSALHPGGRNRGIEALCCLPSRCRTSVKNRTAPAREGDRGMPGRPILGGDRPPNIINFLRFSGVTDTEAGKLQVDDDGAREHRGLLGL